MDEFSTKIERIKDIVKYAGLACPPPEVVLNKLHTITGDKSMDTFNHVLHKYREYVFSYRLQNYDTEENFIKTELRLMNIDSFIFGRKFNQSYPLPQTDMIKAMFGKKDFFEMNKVFHEKLALMKPIRNKNLLKLKTLTNEKKNPTSTENIK